MDEVGKQLRAAHAALRDVQASADSEDGTVSVTLDAGGCLRELVLSPRIYREPDSEALADAILDTTKRAQRLVEVQVLKALQPFLPPDAGLESTDLALDPLLHNLRSANQE